MPAVCGQDDAGQVLSKALLCPAAATKKAAGEAARTMAREGLTSGARPAALGLFYFKPRSHGAFCLPPKKETRLSGPFQEWSASALMEVVRA